MIFVQKINRKSFIKSMNYYEKLYSDISSNELEQITRDLDFSIIHSNLIKVLRFVITKDNNGYSKAKLLVRSVKR